MPFEKNLSASVASFERRERPKTTLEKLREVTARMAGEINASVEEEYGLRNIVDETSRIRPLGYALERGGIYDAETITDDAEVVAGLDRQNSAADILTVQEFFRTQHGIETPEGIVQHHLQEKEKNKSNQTEMAITVLLHKFLKERFLVVRASVFDDYKHGMDNLILDKQTGAIVCAFDEVLRNEGDKKKAPVKIDKIKKKALQGGTEAKYGFSLKDGTLVRDHVRNIPVFYLSLDSDNLDSLAKSLLENFDGDASLVEKELFAHLVQSIQEQKTMLESLPALPSKMKQKLANFNQSLEFLQASC